MEGTGHFLTRTNKWQNARLNFSNCERELQLRRRAAEIGHMTNRNEKLRALKADAIAQEMTRIKGVLSATPSNMPTARMLDQLKKELKELASISHGYVRDAY